MSKIHTFKGLSAATFLTLGLVASSAFAQSAADYDEFGINLGKLNISPFINVSWVYDDNPQNVREGTKLKYHEAYAKGWIRADADPDPYKKDSSGISIQPGVDITLPGNNWKLTGRLHYLAERFDDDDNDRDDWSETLTLNGETEGEWSWHVSELVRQSIYQDEDYPDFTQDDRLQLQLSAGVGKSLSEKTTINLGAAYNDVDFDDPTLHDYHTYSGSIRLSRALTDKTDWTLSGIYKMHESDDFKLRRNGPELRDYAIEDRWTRKSDTISALLGLKSRSTEKLSFDVAAGLEYIDCAENRAISDADEDDIDFTYSIAVLWRYTERITFSLNGHGSYQPAQDVDNNSMDRKTLRFRTDYRLGQRWKLNAGIGYAIEDYRYPIVDSEDDNAAPYQTDERLGKDRQDDILSYFGGAVFALNNYASIFVDLNYTDASSSISNYDYDRLRISAGLSLRY